MPNMFILEKEEITFIKGNSNGQIVILNDNGHAKLLRVDNGRHDGFMNLKEVKEVLNMTGLTNVPIIKKGLLLKPENPDYNEKKNRDIILTYNKEIGCWVRRKKLPKTEFLEEKENKRKREESTAEKEN